ncbi:MAG: T9SS type A sorting domain-containing protein [Chitinophagales bacterium]
MNKIFTLFTLLFVFVSYIFADCGNRYIDTTFPVKKYTDIQYGFNFDSKNNPTNLLLDVYTPDPTIDNENKKPLIIFVHGGSFIGGDRNDQGINQTAAYFASLGYATANIEYRVQQTTIFNPILDFADYNNFYQAIIRGMHDVKAAIRFFKKDVVENGNSYGIDTNNIILYGSSAGAIISLHTVFLDDTSEMDFRFKPNFDVLGGLEGNSGNAGYSSNNVKTVISCSGALHDPNYLNNNADINYIGFHNTIDFTVPYELGCFVTAACFLGYFYGDKPIYNNTVRLNMNSEFYPVEGYGHPVDQYADTATFRMIREKSKQFLYNIFCEEAINDTTTVTAINKNTIKPLSVYPNPIVDKVNIQLPNELLQKEVTLSYTDITGRVLNTTTRTINSNIIALNVDFLAKGMYLLQVSTQDDNTIYTTKLLKQ